MSAIREQSITSLPQSQANPQAAEPPNPAQDVLMFVGDVTSVVTAPVDMLNQGVASLTNGISNVLPSFPAARTLVDLVFGWPHSHPHPPSFGTPLPSIGPVLLAGSLNVLINGLPAARCGDIGFGAWCGGYFPMFEVFTGSSNVFIGGARASRMLIDFTRHCSLPFQGKNLGKGLGAMDKVMMGVLAGMGALGVAAQVTDSMNQAEAAENADSAEIAAAASAASSAAALGAAMTAAQTAADMAVLALSVGMGKDPGLPPLACFGNFITGSMNVLIGGLPIPGWTHALAGLGKLLRRVKYKGKHRKQNNGCGKAGEPIEIVTGANIDEFTDYSLDTPHFIWRRWYDSQLIAKDCLGWGFRHEYQHELFYNEIGSEFIYKDNKGNSITFPSFLTSVSGEYVSADGFRLTRQSDKRFNITSYNSPTFIFEFNELSESSLLTGVKYEVSNLSFEYDSNQRLSTISIDKDKTVHLSYNSLGFLNDLHLDVKGEDTLCIAQYLYDEKGRMIEFRDHRGNKASYKYDSAHLMTRKTDRRGYSFHYKYDRNGRCVHTKGDDGLYQISFDYQPEENKTVVKYLDGGNWIYEYNESKTIIRITDPYGGDKHRIVDPDTGLVKREIDSASNVIELLYDEDGTHTGRIDSFGNWSPPLDEDPHPLNPNQHEVPETPLEWEFGKLSPKYYANNQDKEIFGFDGEHNETLYIDSDGKEYRKEYSSWNLLRREIDPLGNSHTFGYSPLEEITRFVDAGGSSHEFIYDKKDRLVEVRRGGITHESYEYDEADNLIKKSDRDGKILFTSVPGKNGLDVIRKFADGQHYRFEYDDRGRVTEAYTQHYTTTKSYDENDHAVIDKINGLGVEHRYEFGELAATTILDKFIITYHIDDDGDFCITDPTGRMHSVHIGIDGAITRKLASETTENIKYNSLGQCIYKNKEAITGVRSSKSYKYTASGDLLLVEDTQKGYTKFYYDDAHRLKIVEYEHEATELYTHDPAGNLVLKPGLSPIKYSTNNQLKQAGKEQFVYDYRGNIIERSSVNGITSYCYDLFDQLIGCRVGNNEWQADYDAFGRRSRKIWNGQITKYFWDNDRLAAEIRPDNSIRIYVYVDEYALVSFLYVDYINIDDDPKSGIVKYLFTNHIGTPERIEDNLGNTIWVGAVSPYGYMRTVSGDKNEISLRFPGHYYDSETGLHYNRFRYYDPGLGSYIQCDPLGITGGYNLYAYSTNPLVEVDILGLTHGNAPRRSNEAADADGTKPKVTPVPKPKKLTKKQAELLELAKQKAHKMAEDYPEDMLPGALTIIRDKKTGKTYTAVSGPPPLSPKNAHKNLNMPRKSQEEWEPGNCAEPKAINEALNDGAKKSDLQIATVDVRSRTRRGETKPCCRNCRKTTRGATVVPSR